MKADNTHKNKKDRMTHRPKNLINRNAQKYTEIETQVQLKHTIIFQCYKQFYSPMGSIETTGNEFGEDSATASTRGVRVTRISMGPIGILAPFNYIYGNGKNNVNDRVEWKGMRMLLFLNIPI